MDVAHLNEKQNEAFDYEYHSEAELTGKLEFIRKAFPTGPKRILDVGGGNGLFMDRLLAAFPEAQGYVLDISQALLDKNVPDGRKRLVHGSFEDMQRLLPNEKFDLVTINWVLHHLVGPSYGQSIHNVQEALALAAESLTAEGVIFVAENEYEGFFGSNAPSHIVYGITRVQNPLFVRLAGRFFNTAGVGVCFQSQASWRRLFSKFGFGVAYYQQNIRWNHGLAKRLMFAGLLLRWQRHGHFALKPVR